jgi:hypothetical protein
MYVSDTAEVLSQCVDNKDVDQRKDMRNLLKSVQRLVDVLFWGFLAAVCEYSILHCLLARVAHER